MKINTYYLAGAMLLLTFEILHGQSLTNFSFEVVDKEYGRIKDWYGPFSSGGVSGYVSEADSLMKIHGKYSLSISVDSNRLLNRTFGACSYTIPAKYAGTKIQLKGYLKTEDISSTGFAGLWIQFEGPEGILGLNNMQDKKITGTNDWKEYTLDLAVDDDAERIIIGGIIAGNTGKIWIDNLRLFIDDVEIQKAPPKQNKIYKARQDSAFNKGSGIKLSKLTEKSISNLQLLGQVWGFLKYYHPAIAEGNFNWDYELFRFLPSYIEVKTNKSRDKALVDWINKLGPPSPCDTCTVDAGGDLIMKPDLNWFENNTIDMVLKEKLEDIKKNRNRAKNYYVSSTPYVGNPIFKNENPYEQFVFPDDGFRVLALFRYWNMIHYFFPYKYAIEQDWNKVLAEFLPKFLHAQNKLEYRLAVLELIGRIHDTHANLWGGDSILFNYRGKYIAPVQTKFIEDKLVVTNYYNSELGKQSEVHVGDVITEINSMTVENIVKEKLKLYPASNYPTKLRDMARDMLRGNDRKIELTIRRDDKLTSKAIQLFPFNSINTSIDWEYNKPDSCYKFITDKIGYIYLGNIESSLLPEIFKTFSSTKGIVIDIRNYPSEFVVFSLTDYLLESQKEFVKFSVGDIAYPGSFRVKPPLTVGRKREDNYKGKIIILINEITQSQAEYTTMALRTALNATVIGSTTAGADGNVSAMVLPGNLNTMISGIGVFYPDGKETQRVGIVPDIEVKPPIRGVIEKRDELVERAIQIIESEK